MKIAGPLIKGRFVERPNRFITMVELGGKIVKSHLPDPGRLKELLFPGAIVYLRPKPDNSTRKTEFSTVMVEQNGVLISLDSTLPNRFFAHELKNNFIPIFKNWKFIKQEYAIGNHRLDFLLEDPNGNTVYTEIKSVTFVENGIAQFPDAVTERGRKHMKLLQSLVTNGKKAMVVFICQRPDADIFRPMWNRDSKFALALQEAVSNGVEIHVVTTNLSKTDMTYYREISVNLTRPNET